MSNNKLVGGDIYEIEKFINEVRKQHVDEDENTLKCGIFGYMGDLFTREINSAILMSSEGLNQMFPTRATSEKYILTHATEANIKDIESIPSIMRIHLGMSKTDIENNMKKNILILDNDIPINIDKYEFHLDYDIRIEKNIVNHKDIFTARYIIDDVNPISDIDNPYILPPIQFSVNREPFLFFNVIVRQVFKNKKYLKIVSNENIENKTYKFKFSNQLSKFYIKIKNGNKYEKIIYPLYRGTPIIDDSKLYCYYDYYNESTIRVYFLDNQYIPTINDEICTIIQTSLGSDGNFEYKKDIIMVAKSNKYEYNDLKFFIKIIEEPTFGSNKKSIDELKTIIPKERLSRSVITCAKDLENFFNGLYDNNNKVKFYKKIQNYLDTKYYAYILMKDIYGNIISSNTIDFTLFKEDFDIENENNFIINPGKKFILKKNNKFATVYKESDINEDGFYYTNIFMMCVNKNPSIVLYYLITFNFTKSLNFDMINNEADLQFIGNRIKWVRELNSNTYKLNISLYQNIKEDMGIIEFDDDNNILNNNITIYGILKDNNGSIVRYKKFDILRFDKSEFRIDSQLLLNTSNNLDIDGQLEIVDMNSMGSDIINPIYINPTDANISIYIYRKEETKYYTNSIDNQLPLNDTDVLCNIYSIKNGLEFLLDYTNIMSSSFKLNEDKSFTFKASPMIKYDYILNKNIYDNIINTIRDKRIYLSTAMSHLEHSIGLSLKFFNTYGPSKSFIIGRNGMTLDRVNISLNFVIKCYVGADNNIKGLVIEKIKTYIENINNISELSISRLTSIILNKFTDIQDFEFKGINGYDTSYQNISNIDINNFKLKHVPEFLNINNKGTTSYIPDINVEII